MTRLGLWSVGMLVLGVACTSGQSGTEEVSPLDGPVADGSMMGDGKGQTPGRSHGGDDSADPARPYDCACGAFQGWTVVEGTVSALESGRAEVEIDVVHSHQIPCELQGGDQDGGVGCRVAQGETLGGAYSGALPCDDVCIDLEVGTRVLALHMRGDQDGLDCPEYKACSLARCGPLDEESNPDGVANWDVCDMECLAELRDVCAGHGELAWLQGTLELAPLDTQQEGIPFNSVSAYDGPLDALASGDERCTGHIIKLTEAESVASAMAGEGSDVATDGDDGARNGGAGGGASVDSAQQETGAGEPMPADGTPPAGAGCRQED